MKPFLFTFILVLLIVAWRNVRSSKSLEDKKYHQPTEKAVRSMVAKSSTSLMTPTLVNSKSSVDSAKKAVETVSAESHKPEPCVRKNVKPQTGSGTGRWLDPKYVGEQDFRELAMCLKITLVRRPELSYGMHELPGGSSSTSIALIQVFIECGTVAW